MVLKKIETINKIIKFLDVPVMDIKTELCYNHRYSDSCSRCLDICPVHAINLSSGGPVINVKDCVLCGACSTVCRNDAILMVDSTDENIMYRIDELSPGFERVRIQCNGCSKRFRIKHGKPPKNTETISVPCLGRLNDTVILYGKLRKPEGLEFSPCKTRCPFYKALRAFDESVMITERLMERPSTEVSINDGKKLEVSFPPANLHAHGRRDFIIESGKRAIEIGFNLGEGDYRANRGSNLRRKRLISMILENGLVSMVSMNDGLPFADLEINAELCDLCGLCERLCPSNALILEYSDDLLNLEFSISKCTNCGICRSICPMSAISIVNNIHLSILDRGDVCLKSGKAENCAECNRPFHISNDGQKFCSVCRKTQNVLKDFSSKARMFTSQI